jgi:small subunit ribosomal protein S6
VLIARNDVTQHQVEGIASQLETEGGAMKKARRLGPARSAAYRIKTNRKGHYMLLGLDGKPAFVTEMERQLSLDEDILRFMTLRVDAIDDAPLAILSRKPDDRERNFRGPKPAAGSTVASAAASTAARNSAREETHDDVRVDAWSTRIAVRRSVGAEQSVPEEVNDREIAVCVQVMDEMKLLLAPEPGEAREL